MIDKIIDEAIRRVPDFPKPGILFYDITSILTNPKVFRYCIDKAVSLYKDANIDALAAIEARGFLFAAPLALELGKPLVLMRKKGKLPGDVFSVKYTIEYGSAEIEVHKSDITKGNRFLVIDDLIATGGTLHATKELLAMGGATVSEFFGIIGLPKLNYKEYLSPTPVKTLLEYDGD